MMAKKKKKSYVMFDIFSRDEPNGQEDDNCGSGGGHRRTPCPAFLFDVQSSADLLPKNFPTDPQRAELKRKDPQEVEEEEEE